MTRTLTATEAKARLLAILDEVAGGEEIAITKHGRTVARLVPAAGPAAGKGRLRGVAVSSSTDEDVFATGLTWDLP